jgi:hypothetical protein
MRVMLTSALLAFAPSPALACLPPPPGTVEPPPPTIQQQAEAIARRSDNIVYGVLTRSVEGERPGKLRIIHVYKGSLRQGNHIAINNSWGFDPPMCAGLMSGPPPAPKGTYGVYAWSGSPEVNLVSDERLAAMFKQKLITPADGS